jgi:hypothetical protein
LEDAPKDYDSLVEAVTQMPDNKTLLNAPHHTFTSHSRILNKRLSRVVLYGGQDEDRIDQRTVLQRCVEEIGRVRDSDKSECGKKFVFVLHDQTSRDVL